MIYTSKKWSGRAITASGMSAFFIFGSLFAASGAVYISNNGGFALSLPYNMLYLMVIGTGVVYLSIISGGRKGIDKLSLLIILSTVIFASPWFIQRPDEPGVWGVAFVLCLYVFLAKLEINHNQQKIIYEIIFFLAIFQAVIGLIQFFLPDTAMAFFEYSWQKNAGRPYGIFQQVNLYASFIATGLGCGYLVLLREIRVSRVLLFVSGLCLLVFVLTLNQSRTGGLGALIIIFLLSLLCGRVSPGKTILYLSAMAASYYIALLFIDLNHTERGYESSTIERWNVATTTWQMIQAKPFLGWGYGTFEYEYSRYILNNTTLPYNVLKHPHNEFLYTWFQGGIIAAMGLILLAICWILMVIRACRYSFYHTSSCMLILPLVLHCCLEFPFYQSLLHFSLFALLLRMGQFTHNEVMPDKSSKPFRSLGVIFGLSLVIFSSVTLYTGIQLTRLEREGLVTFPHSIPWYYNTQNERVHFDKMLSLLIRYNKEHEPALLDKFIVEAEEWSGRHNDKNVYRSLIMIYHYRNDVEKLNEYYKLYDDMFVKKHIIQEE
ncbi:O-antigen ligase family protein [Enterobacter ludwigii]|uniref:O-antigen ligase family protein n=1 Tax=Enterobacter ludwigii TaxID=299767 RepID=UPI00159CA142|nr:pilin glycosylation ligase domain-containing protein [Enterobacter ludwigii]QLA06937.1 O-antigen ligase family protein [Enterobacter ludwigii]